MWIKEEYLAEILGGRKTVEVRVGYPNIMRLVPGDTLLLNDRYEARVLRVAHYANFAELLAHEDVESIAPGLTSEELAAILHQIYPPEKEALGAVALELAVNKPEEHERQPSDTNT
ncbi:MAG: ASCH domain-containing protein [Chloroflexi bacterium]|nr:ASCH domain-containing protein [Chloroflexota bacterium]